MCANGGATYIIRKIIAKDNLNIVNCKPLQTFEKFLLQNYRTELLDIAHKLSLIMCN